jgi:hypothetical protein
MLNISRKDDREQTSIPVALASDIIRTIDRDGNPFAYHLRDLYPNEGSYQYINKQAKLFEECLAELISRYGGKYVVFEDGKVIDLDENEDTLLERIWDTDFIKERMGVNGHGIYCHLVLKAVEVH